MSNNRLLVSALAMILCLTLARGARGAAPAAPPETPASSWEDYKVLVERNIFLRNRSRRETRRSPAPAAPVYPPEHFVVLTGMARAGNEYIALVEDTRSDVTTKVRVGDTVADGRIARIALNHVEYVKGDKTVKVVVGATLEGAAPTLSSPAGTAASPEASTSPAAPAAGGTAEERAILERLRQRRQQEMNPK